MSREQKTIQEGREWLLRSRKHVRVQVREEPEPEPEPESENPESLFWICGLYILILCMIYYSNSRHEPIRFFLA